MAIRTLWMDSDGMGALEYPSRDFRDLITVLYDPGVMDLAGLKVIQRAAGANMSVSVTGPGRAIIESSYTTDMGYYLATVTATVTDIVIGAAPGAGTRRDIVGLQAQDDAAGGPTDVRETRVVVVVGDTSGSDPTLPASFLPLARVRVPSGTVSIIDSLVDDLRVVAGKREEPGTYRDVAHNLTVSGWLDCDGSAISRSTYAALFAAIGTTYGVGNGSTTFNVPDHRGRLPVSAAAGATGSTRIVTGAVGAAGGAKDATLPTHTHSSAAHADTTPAHQHVTSDDGDAYVNVGGLGAPLGSLSSGGITTYVKNFSEITTGPASPTTDSTTPGSTGSTGSSATDANVPPFVTVRRLIRT